MYVCVYVCVLLFYMPYYRKQRYTDVQTSAGLEVKIRVLINYLYILYV